MKTFKMKEEVINTIINEQNILIVQDLDGVCIPLVQDPLQREINKEFIKNFARLREKFAVLTCGEHEGRRGVNRLVEKALNSKTKAKENGFYLPGLAACGVEYQDRYGNKFTNEFDSLLARLIQHEVDHLNGNLIINRVSKAEKIRVNKELRTIKENSLKTMKSKEIH